MKLNATSLAHRTRLSEAAVEPEVLRVLTWYFKQAYGRLEGPERTPFYCDPARVLQNAGKVSAELAKAHAEREFVEFRRTEDRSLESDFDRAVKRLPAPVKDKP